MTRVELEEGIWTADGLLSSEECEHLILEGERLGFAFAPVTTNAGMVDRPDIRNNDRAMVDAPELTEWLWKRFSPLVRADEIEGWTPVGLNERLRWYRYTVGQRFKPHYDGAFVRSREERSFCSVLFYLDEGCEGGATRFLEPNGEVRLSFVPKRGSVLVFFHPTYHEGEEVRAGQKHVLRSDLMFRRE